jgi:SagB-type dehydrogenase family enzyme
VRVLLSKTYKKVTSPILCTAKGDTMDEGIGDKFQKETKYSPRMEGGAQLDWSTRPELYKVYPDKEKRDLPPVEAGSVSLDEVLKKRKSVRRFSQKPLTQQQLSYLLWASTGIERREQGYEFRTAPSAGALYPVETYIVAHNIKDLPRGVYHYSIKDHALEELELGDFRRAIATAALEQQWCFECAAVFVWTAIFYRMKWKYNQRAYRYIYLDAGHIGQNLALASVSLGLGSCQIGAVFDDEVNKIIQVDSTSESTIYLSVVGYPL